ncbi:hypothetical protein Tco_0697573 [Tanacetum coccineum]
MAQQIIPAAQLVSKFQGIRRSNNYAVLQSIPCSPECKIVGKFLLDIPLCYALTATADVPAMYLQQFWQTVHKVPDTKDTIRFKLNTQEITYTVDMFRDTLKLPVETPDNPFITLVTIETIESFMHTIGYQGVVDKVIAFYTKQRSTFFSFFHVVVNRTNVDYAALLWWDFMNNVFQKKNVIQYSGFIKLMIVDLMEKYPSIPRIHDEDYHSIKDDTPLVSVYSVGNVLFRGMQILDAFLTVEIRTTNDYKEYETVFVRVDVPMNQPQPIVSTQGTYRSSPRAHGTPTLTAASPEGKKRMQRAGETMAEATILSLTLHKIALAAEAQENIAKVQEKLDEEEIEKMVEGDEDEESYASEFVDSMINDDVDDSGTRKEPESHKEHLNNVNDDDENIKKEIKDDEIKKEKKNDDVEKTDEVVKEKDNDEGALDSMEFRNEKMQTPIPRPTRSPRTDLSSDKIISEELTAIVSPTTATTSKVSSTPKRKKRFIFIQDRRNHPGEV